MATLIKKPKSGKTPSGLDRLRQLSLNLGKGGGEEIPTPTKDDVYMRKKASMMWNDPEWHSHMRPAFEIPIHNNLKFIAYINPVMSIELHFYRLGRKDEANSWYSVGKFKAFGHLDEAVKTITELMDEIGGQLKHVSEKLRQYAKENPYDNKKYAGVEEWLKRKSR